MRSLALEQLLHHNGNAWAGDLAIYPAAAS
jgi:hypothetical protein